MGQHPASRFGARPNSRAVLGEALVLHRPSQDDGVGPPAALKQLAQLHAAAIRAALASGILPRPRR
jgi:hypothetical protein